VQRAEPMRAKPTLYRRFAPRILGSNGRGEEADRNEEASSEKRDPVLLSFYVRHTSKVGNGSTTISQDAPQTSGMVPRKVIRLSGLIREGTNTTQSCGIGKHGGPRSRKCQNAYTRMAESNSAASVFHNFYMFLPTFRPLLCIFIYATALHSPVFGRMTPQKRQRTFIAASIALATVAIAVAVMFNDELSDPGLERDAVGTIGAAAVSYWQGTAASSLEHSWYTDENWKKKVPHRGTDVIIDKGHSTERLDAEAPPPSAGDTASVHDLFIYAGGKLTFASSPVPGALKIYGSWHSTYQSEVALGNGTLIIEGNAELSDEARCDAGAGTIMFRGEEWSSPSPSAFFASMSKVIFEGNSQQTIRGNMAFYDLDLRTADSVRIEGHVVVTNALTLGPDTRIVVSEGSALVPPPAFANNDQVVLLSNRKASKTKATTLQTLTKAVEMNVPASLALEQNFPNPFNPTTTIRFTASDAAQTTLKVYDIQGREIATLFDEMSSPGQSYSVQFDGTGLSSGTYLYALQAGAERKVGKMILKK